jgi:hypothetical protein
MSAGRLPELSVIEWRSGLINAVQFSQTLSNEIFEALRERHPGQVEQTPNNIFE